MIDKHEYFLDTYFQIFSIAKNVLPQARDEVFYSLAKAFMLDYKNAHILWDAVNSDTVNKIVDRNHFLQYNRIKQYSKEVLHNPVEESELEAEVVTIKGSALTQALECGIITDKEEGKERIITNLVNKACEGCMNAMRVLGVMQMHGLLVEEDKEAGLKNLLRTARWNDISGSIMYLYYNPANRQGIFNSLVTTLKMRYNNSLIRSLEEEYPKQAIDFQEDMIASLIEKAFNSSFLSRVEYASPKARILNSEILTYQDKETAIFSMENKQRRSPICDLPLKLIPDQSIDLNLSAFEDFLLSRQDEVESIINEAQNFDLRRMSNYTPMCLCSDSHTLLQYYVSGIEKLPQGANVQIIEVGDLSRSDIEATDKNVFVRKCDEDKLNVYILAFRGNIAPDIMEVALDFLRSSRRRAFCLNQPALQLDLSGILPICVCDRANDATLRKLCNVINLASVSKEEKGLIIDETIARKAKTYGIDDISIADGVKDSVQKLSTDNIVKLLDKAILANRRKGDKLILDDAKLGKMIEEFKSINKYGFGGSVQ